MGERSFRLPPLLFEPPHNSIEKKEHAKDKEYARTLEKFLEEGIAKLNLTEDREEEFALHRACFDRIVTRLPAYGPLLSSIKVEYERFIEALRLGEMNLFYLDTKLCSLEGKNETAKIYEKRCVDLETKIDIIERDNKKLEKEIKKLRDKRISRETEMIRLLLEPEPLPEMTTERRQTIIKKMTLEKSTDMKALERELAEHEDKIKSIQQTENKRFVAKSHKEELMKQLTKKEGLKEKLLLTNEDFKQRLHKLRMAIEATSVYLCDSSEGKLTLADVVERALAGERFKRSNGKDRVPSSLEDDDPAKEKETQMILEFIERWNELMADKKYEAAAIHAANSPRGVLRTSETLSGFKSAPQVPGRRSPLLMYCEILLSTVTDELLKPSRNDSIECVKCALEHGKLELVAHWLAIDVLEYSPSLGALIKNWAERVDPKQHRFIYSLAQTAYMRAGAHKQTAICMCKQGRYQGMLAYAREIGTFKSEDYLGVLQAVPHLELALLFVQSSKKTCLPFVAVKQVYDVLKVCNESVIREFLEKLASRKDLIDVIWKDNRTSKSDWMTLITACEQGNLLDEGIEILASVAVAQVLAHVNGVK